ncbi:winged helix-turn-helix domain-containing protein [Nonomuraea sp. C10]|uniref:ArsR/SmtB family transcription factor n=1 Tax=Nonomuraea sp. C10 TaxID=2600577 RepID=UPI0021C496CE|nr:winged helix-turn-helix domain-containing protein [Nonomuraea sp. C10]
MGLELTFTAQDAANVRFAASPLWEVVASVRVVKDPAAHAVLKPWAERVRRRLADVDWRLLSDLVPVPTISIVGFVCPPPSTSVPDLEVELAGMAAMAPLVQEGLDVWDGPRTRALQELYADPVGGLERLAEEIRSYWQAAIAPYWPRVRALLEGDVLYRARLLAEGGLRRMLSDLDPAVTWEGETLRLPKTVCEGVRPLGGLGLLLVPSVFTWPRVFSITTPPWQPTIRYPPRGVATLWEHRESDPPQALAAVLGRTRTRLLAELDQPASTRELAARLDLSEPGANQHLTALRRAGLASAHRTGRYVLYARTAVAETLLAGDASPIPSGHEYERAGIAEVLDPPRAH